MSADPVLDAACDAVRRDLEATGACNDAAVEWLALCTRERGWWLAQWPGGAAYVVGLLAQDVQEAVHEHADRQWPLCPDHADHPLYVEPDLGPDAFWVCHRSGLPCAPIGQLPASSR